MRKQPTLDLLHYTDYRQLLAEYLRWRREVDGAFLAKELMLKAGFTGPNYLRELLDGKKNLSEEGAARLAAAMGLSEPDQLHFTRLVRFNQSRQAEEKLALLQEMVAVAPDFEVAKLALGQLELLGDGAAVALREALHAHPSTIKELGELGERLCPPLARRESLRAFRALQALDLVREGPDGCWRPTERIMATEPQVAGLAALAYHRNKVQLALQALENFGPKEREFQGITGSWTDATWERIREEMWVFHRKVLQLIEEEPDGPPRRVHHLGMQLFPLERGPIQRRAPRKGRSTGQDTAPGADSDFDTEGETE